MSANSYRFFSYYLSRRGSWFRLFGYGLVLTSTRPLFSERNGFVKRLHLWGPWRIGVIRP